MDDRTLDVSEYTGSQFQNRLNDLVDDIETWRGGKIYKFHLKVGEQSMMAFSIKAVVKQSSVEELLRFRTDENKNRDGWNDLSAYLSEEAFSEYYSRYMTDSMNLFVDDFLKEKDYFKLCIMITFEIARSSPIAREDLESAIKDSLETRSDENISDMCKMFPIKGRTKNEDETRIKAMKNIIRRKKMSRVQEVNRRWPAGENTDDLLEIFSRHSYERVYAFESFLKRKERREEILLEQNERDLEDFMFIIRGDAVSCRQAFERLNLRKKNEEK